MNQFLQKITAAALTCAMVCTLSVSAFAAGSLDHFKTLRTYENQFSDLGGWYRDSVIAGYELGLFDGVDENHFAPDRSMTVGEAVKLAACLNRIYETGTVDFSQGEPWWEPYAEYCLSHEIISAPYEDYSNAISRAEFAVLFAEALPERALSEMNCIPDGAVPDVKGTEEFGPAVYRLYRAGILTGSDASGTFRPNTNIRRSEMAAILLRMADITERRSVQLGGSRGELTGEQLYEKCAPSICAVLLYDAEGKQIAYGSAVFLTSDGQAVTNWHVLDGAHSAKVRTQDGKLHDVLGVYEYRADRDLARIQVDGGGFAPIAVDYSGTQKTGATVYAIGNPKGMDSTLSVGIVSAAHREVDGGHFIQTTTPISNGSSGGALLNTRGELIGITSGSISEGQNLNLAIPISALLDMNKQSYQSVSAASESYVKQILSTFTLSEETVVVPSGGEKAVTCAAPGIRIGYSMTYEIEDRNIVRCSWGEWQDHDTIDLTLSGRKFGETSVKVILKNHFDRVLGERTLHVVVQ